MGQRAWFVALWHWFGRRGRRFTASLIGVIALTGGSLQLATTPAKAATPIASSSKPVSHLGAAAAPLTPTQPVSVPRLWTANSRTTLEPDGTYQAKFWPAAVNYRDSTGAWQPIDDTLTADAAGVAHTAANSWQVDLPPNLTSPVKVTDGTNWVSFALQGASPAATQRLSKATATYTDALPGVTVAYTAGNNQLAETLTLADARAASNFTYHVTASTGLSVTNAADGSIAITDTAGKTVFSFAAPTLADSSNSPAGQSSDATLTVTSPATNPPVTTTPATTTPATTTPATTTPAATSPVTTSPVTSSPATTGTPAPNPSVTTTSIPSSMSARAETSNASPTGSASTSPSTTAIVTEPTSPATTAPATTDTPAVSSPTTSGSGWTVTLTADKTWLDASSRVWPVVIDPTVSFGSSGTQGCEVVSDYPTANDCSQGTYYLAHGAGGGAGRGFYQFNNLTTAIPRDALINNADFALYEQASSTTNTTPLEAHALTQPWTTGATWNTYDGANAWPTSGPAGTTDAAGGDYLTASAWTLSNVAGLGGSWLHFYPSSLVQSWLSGNQANDGFIVKEPTADETTVNDYLTIPSFNNSNSSLWPSLTVDYDWHYNTNQSWSAHLDDHLTASVDVASGNLQIAATDLHINSFSGLDVSATRYWNSLRSGADNDAGMGWLTGLRDVALQLKPSGINLQAAGGEPYEYYTPSGGGSVTCGSGTYVMPPGIDADLCANTDGVTYTLTYHGTQQVWTFKDLNPGDGVAVLQSEKDRNGNTITYTWDPTHVLGDGLPTLDSVTDTEGRTLTVGNPTGPISGYTDTAGRSVGYHYTSGKLTSFTDANGQTTSYGYTGNLLTEVTTPGGRITTFGYNGSNQVTSITQVTNNSTLTGYSTTFTYNNWTGTGVPTATTVVTDPNSHTTTYTHDGNGHVTSVQDGNGNTTTYAYNANGDQTSVTNALGQTSTNGFDSIFNPQYSQANASASGQTAAMTDNSYALSGTPSVYGPAGSTTIGYQYLASSSTDVGGLCQADSYDSNGNLSYSYQGITASGSGSTRQCNGDTSSNETVNTYAGDYLSGTSGPTVSCGGRTGETGQLCTSTNAKGGTTSYTYDSSGNLITITPPSPQSASHITYDSLSRVQQVTDGASRTVKYTYDNLDHVTRANYNPSGDPSCANTATCVSYTYDNDGNLTQQVDNTGTTTNTYDALNRLVATAIPGAASNTCASPHDTAIHYTYDGVGNLTAYCDGGGTVSYTYDAANNLTGVADPGGSCTPGSITQPCTTYAYDKANQRTAITYPTATGVREAIGYDQAGNVTGIQITKGAQQLVNRDYTYTNTTTPTGDLALLQSTTNNTAANESVEGWGLNGNGQLGNGTTTSSATPAVTSSFPSLSGSIVQVVKTQYTGYALSSSGQVYAWGYGGYGQLGNGTTTTSQTTPVLTSSFPGLSGTIIQISGGGSTAYALSSSGQVYAWGAGSYGQLGNSTTTSTQTTPVLVSSFPSLSGSIIQLSSGTTTGYALSSTGQVYAWGYGTNGQLGNGTTTANQTTPVLTSSFPSLSGAITQISGGGSTGYALSSSGQVYSWGQGPSGQLGNGTTTANQTTPVLTSSFPSLSGAITQISGGGSTGYALSSSGQVYAWGAGSDGQLGNGTATTAQSTPVAVAAFPAASAAISQISGAEANGYALTASGQVYAWGLAGDDGLGNGTAGNNYGSPALTTGPLMASLAQGSTSYSEYGLYGTTTTYSYTDSMNRLNSAVDTGGDTNSWTYAYDGDGNMTSQSATIAGTTTNHIYTYNAADELTTGSAAYDGAGNQTATISGTTLIYNALSQTTSLGGGPLAYTGTGQDGLTTDNSTTLQNSSLGVTATTSFGTTINYTRDPAGNLVTLRDSGSNYYYLTDPHGSVIGIINNTGTLSASYTYDPYGNLTNGTPSGIGATNPFRYNSGYQNASGYYHYGARYYDPTVGRWTQLDPTGHDAGYVYAGDDPVSLSDRSGTDKQYTFTTPVAYALGAALTLGGPVIGIINTYFGTKIGSGPIGQFILDNAGDIGKDLMNCASALVPPALSCTLYIYTMPTPARISFPYHYEVITNTILDL